MENILAMDNDSGYVSHNTESNLDSSLENVCKTKEFCNVFISEDALLEKPLLKETAWNKNESFDSVVNSSQESVKTEFSGFEDSDSSLIIPEAKTIVWDSNNEENKENNSLRKPLLPPPGKPKIILAEVTNTYSNGNESTAQTPQKRYENMSSNMSPDLFEEDNYNIPQSPVPKKIIVKQQKCHPKDVKLLKQLQSGLSGVHPPPSVTIIQISVEEMLEKLEKNKDLFCGSEAVSQGRNLSVDQNKDCLKSEWPEISKHRYHGLHYNRSKLSEELEHLYVKYAERYIGAETHSSCTVFDANSSSSQKKRLTKPRWSGTSAGAKSPGRRLSHLARRRITFSGSNIPGSSGVASVVGSRARQILVDARKLSSFARKSPRKTPSKSPFKMRKNTPSSSAKKKLAMRFREMSGEFENIQPSTSTSTGTSFKRALFGEPSMEKKSTKRALFSSPGKSKSPLKRKRTDSDCGNPSKLARSLSLDQQTRGDFSLLLNRTISETTSSKSEELTEQHKKKLQWAVYESLRLQNVTPTHPQYKIFASVLARVTRKFLPSLKFEGRTTEKMFRIARLHSYAVVKGKTVDEIFNEYMKNRLKNQKPQGYVAIEDFKGKESGNVLQDKANILENIEKRREHSGSKGSNAFSQNRIDRIRKVISFEDSS